MEPATRNCPRCHTLLIATVGGQICPACALQQALAAEDDPDKLGDGETFPRLFGGYELLGELGRGGMGLVFTARQLSLGRLVALKVLLYGVFGDKTVRRRFQAEAESAARLQHPNIVAIHEVGEHDGVPYLTMDLVDGPDLGRLCNGRPLPPTTAARYVRDIARAVQVAHDAGVLHRDLKPSNILVGSDGRPRVTDFGLAKREDTSASLGLTAVGQILGSPSYVSPEQAAGRLQDVAAASDIYGLGAILYHLITGRAPFVAATATQTLRLVLDTEPVPPRLLNPALPRDLETICLKCLQKDPARRYATAAAVADDCDRFLAQRPIRARRPSLFYRIHKFARRHRLGCAAAIAVAVLVVAGLAMLIRASHAESLAQQRRVQIEQVFAQALHVADPGYSRGRQATLKDLLDETARWAPETFKDDPRLDAGIQARMGETYCKLSLFEEAAPHLEAAWAAREKLLPKEDPDYLTSLRDLGVLRLWQQRYAEAEEHLGRVLAIQERALGRDAEDTLRTRHEIAFGRELRLTLGIGFKDEAERTQFIKAQERFTREGYDIARRRLGEEHPLTLLSQWNVALTLLHGMAAQFVEAELILARNYQVSSRVLGREHPNTMQSMVEWGRALVMVGRNDEGLKLLLEAIPLAERTLGASHLTTAWGMQQLEQALRNAGRVDEASELVSRYVSAWMRTYGPTNRLNLSFAFWKLHVLITTYARPEMAAQVALGQLSEFRDRLHLPSDSPAIGVMNLVLADARLAQDRIPEGEEHLRVAVEILGRDHPTSWQLWFVYLKFGQHFNEQRQFPPAETALLTAYDGLNRRGVWGKTASGVQAEVITTLVQLYTGWDQPAKAAEWQQKLDTFKHAESGMPK